MNNPFKLYNENNNNNNYYYQEDYSAQNYQNINTPLNDNNNYFINTNLKLNLKAEPYTDCKHIIYFILLDYPSSASTLNKQN